MRIPVISGIIRRRVLVNYRVDPERLARWLPPPFRPQLVGGWGIAGICLIRLEGVRPRWLPGFWGIASENAAHRVAVEWEDGGGLRRGVFIPRRDTSSRANALAGGRLFPGVHHHAAFDVCETSQAIRLCVASDDGAMRLDVRCRVINQMPRGSVFRSFDDASEFFRGGSLGYSVTRRPGCYEALELRTRVWSLEPLAIECVESSFFADERHFPARTIEPDSAFIMRDIRHEWHAHPPLVADTAECLV